MAPLNIFLVCAAGVALLAALAAQRYEAGRLKLDFMSCGLFCEAHPLIPSLNAGNFFEAIYRRTGEVSRSAALPTVLQLGAGDFAGDLQRYGPLLHQLRVMDPRLVLVEPHPKHALRTKELAATLLPGERLNIVNKAVAPDCSEGPLKMYGWSDRLQDLFTRYIPLDGYISSDRGHPPRAVKGAAKDPFNPFRGDFARVANLESLDDYVEEILFECTTLQDLLAEIELRPQDIAYVAIDDQGFHNHILLQLLDLEGFRPAFVMHKTSLNRVASAWRRYRAQGYLLGTAEGGIIIAVDSRLFNWPPWQLMLHRLQPLLPCSIEGLCEPLF